MGQLPVNKSFRDIRSLEMEVRVKEKWMGLGRGAESAGWLVGRAGKLVVKNGTWACFNFISRLITVYSVQSPADAFARSNSQHDPYCECCATVYNPQLTLCHSMSTIEYARQRPTVSRCALVLTLRMFSPPGQGQHCIGLTGLTSNEYKALTFLVASSL